MRYLLCILALFLLLYSCKHETVRLDDYEIHGVDVSHYQSSIDWNLVAAQDISFAFVKATEGRFYADSFYCTNWEEIKRVGMKRGAYHFYRPTISAIEQANNFMGLVEMEFGDLPPVLDVEVLDGVSKNNLIRGLYTWLFLVETHYNIKPIVYTNLNFYNKYLAGHFDDYPVWIARYNTRKPTLACGRDWQFWQYGNRGQLLGIDGPVDFNVFKGNLIELEAMCLSSAHVLSIQ